MISREFLMRVYNLLPLADCGECGLPNCKEFAEKVILGEKSVFECTKVTNENAQGISLVLDEYMR